MATAQFGINTQVVGRFGQVFFKTVNGRCTGDVSKEKIVNFMAPVTPERVLSQKLCMDVPAGHRKLGLSVYQFFAQSTTHQYTIFKRKAPNFAQI